MTTRSTSNPCRSKKPILDPTQSGPYPSVLVAELTRSFALSWAKVGERCSRRTNRNAQEEIFLSMWFSSNERKIPLDPPFPKGEFLTRSFSLSSSRYYPSLKKRGQGRFELHLVISGQLLTSVPLPRATGRSSLDHNREFPQGFDHCRSRTDWQPERPFSHSSKQNPAAGNFKRADQG